MSSTSNATTTRAEAQVEVANLLKGAEIHNKSGEKMLQESRIADERMHQQEFSDNKSNKQHTYKVTKIEVLDSNESSTSNGTVAENLPQLRTANLLKDAEIHNKSGEKILQESMIADERMHQQDMAQSSPEA